MTGTPSACCAWGCTPYHSAINKIYIKRPNFKITTHIFNKKFETEKEKKECSQGNFVHVPALDNAQFGFRTCCTLRENFQRHNQNNEMCNQIKAPAMGTHSCDTGNELLSSQWFQRASYLIQQGAAQSSHSKKHINNHTSIIKGFSYDHSCSSHNLGICLCH